jgi:hypothetical protein
LDANVSRIRGREPSMDRRREEEAEEIAVPAAVEELVDRDAPHPAHKKGTERDDSDEQDEDTGRPLGPG